MTSGKLKLIATSAVALALAACGGGGGVSSMPTPTPSPSPTPTPTPTPTPSPAAVSIFPNPAPGEFTTVGASIAEINGNFDTLGSEFRFQNVSHATAEQPAIRYTAAGTYEIKMPNSEWDQLIQHEGSEPFPGNNNFQPSSVSQNEAYLVTAQSQTKGYLYSEMGSWGSAAAGRVGTMAFGDTTPASAVPTSGTATFNGFTTGTADVLTADYLLGGFAPTTVDGLVQLKFDFGKGTLGGAMSLTLLDPLGNQVDIGNFAFANTVLSGAGYSGKFATDAAGDNFFLGSFTGPHAEETIGAWAVPFVDDSGGDYMPADHQLHQAFGAWIAKQ